MKFKIVDNSDVKYPVVYDERLGENITIHPSVRDKSKIEGDYLIAPDDHRYVIEHVHAIRCRCKKCCGLMDKFIDTVKGTGATVVDSKDKKGIKELFESLKK
tara:strand:- start:267 stop:572 length:306 start_codon:yes stop_codon:yes gene_type:complete